MPINKDNIDKLLAKYLDNSLNEDEKATVENWINANENNLTEFNAYKQLWESSEEITIKVEVDTQSAWENVYGKINQAKVRKLNTWYNVAAAIAVVTFLSSAIYFLFNQTLRTIEHTAEQNKIIELTDQSTVELQKGSKVAYLEDFNDKSRKVKLEGTAKFDVAKSPNPFIVDAKQLEVAVLGTSFLVEAHEGDSLIKIDVYSGKVSVRSKNTNEKIILTKNQKVTYNIKQQTFKLNKRKLKFNQTPLVAVFDTLSKVYNIKIIVDQQAIKNCVFSGHFSTHDVNQIIKQICYSYGLRTENKGSVHYINGKPNC